MTLWTWLQGLAAVSSLVVVAFALARGPSSPLRLPLVLLAIDQLAWNAAAVGLELGGDDRLRWGTTIASPLFVPFALHFVVLFVGQGRRLRPVLAAVYAVFAVKSLLSVADFVALDGAGSLVPHRKLILALGLPVGLFAVSLVVRHLRGATSETERWRAKLLLAALVTVTLLLPTDHLAALGLPVPPLTTIGSLAFNLALAHLVLGVGIVAGQRRHALLYAALTSLLVVGSYAALFMVFRQRVSVLLITMIALTLGFAAVLRLVLTTLLRARANLEREASLGRFSAQMAHDLKNPLSAALGASEVLEEEMRRKADPKAQQLAGLVVAQLERLNDVIDRYQRMSKLELDVREVDVNALVKRVLALQGFATKAEHVDLREELAPSLPFITADPELLASALENLVKNALEAIPAAGVVTVSTAAGAERVTVAVRDTGAGMDPRVREQAFTPFFTTKAKGSGLGLAFVRQVARAHGGDACVESTEGAGTRVELMLPLKAQVAHG